MSSRHLKALSCTVLALACQSLAQVATAGDVEGTAYYLPKTHLRFSVKVERTTYAPGEFAIYSEKYLRLNDVGTKPEVTYRLLDLGVHSVGERDTSKFFLAPTDSKHSIQSLRLDENGTLLSVNALPKEMSYPAPFAAAPRPAPLNPRDYMTEDILSAGSYAKMAELCAWEIYDLRESKAMLSKGQADFMPNDADQMRLMLRELDTREAALMQLFTGVTARDTIETILDFVPTAGSARQLLFRVSKWAGLTDADDLGGRPFFIEVEDMGQLQRIREGLISPRKDKEKDRDIPGIYVNIPGKIRVRILDGDAPYTTLELFAAQAGKTEMLSDELFSKKYATSLVLNPVTGSIDSLDTDVARK